MEFLKITDQNKRDELVKEYLRLRDNLHDQQISEKIGEINKQKEAEKQFKPLIESNQQTQDLIQNQIQNQSRIFRDALDNAIEDKKNSDGSVIQFTPLAAKYLTIPHDKKIDYDSTFGIKFNNDGNMILGDEIINFKEGHLVIQDQQYKETPGLWELLTKQKPNKELVTDQDQQNYEDIMINTNNLYKDGKIKGNYRGIKYTEYIKPIISKLRAPGTPRMLPDIPTGKGIKTITLSCDPKQLLQRMDLLFESKRAGNNNVKTELDAIVDKLYKVKVINKNLHLKLKKQI